MTTQKLHGAQRPPASLPRGRRRARLALVALLAVAALVAGLLTYRAVRMADVPAATVLEVVEPVEGAPTEPPAGRWTLAAGSAVGYRVTEPAEITVVGRTEAVQGGIDVEGSGAGLAIAAGTVRADLRELRSDASARDDALRSRILESNEFPAAVFTLSGPLEVGPLAPGVPRAVAVPGTLTLRERTAPVTADLTVRWDGDSLRVVGPLDISLADYAVEVVQVAGVDSIDDAAQVEVDLVLEPPAQPVP